MVSVQHLRVCYINQYADDEQDCQEQRDKAILAERRTFHTLVNYRQSATEVKPLTIVVILSRSKDPVRDSSAALRMTNDLPEFVFAAGLELAQQFLLVFRQFGGDVDDDCHNVGAAAAATQMWYAVIG